MEYAVSAIETPEVSADDIRFDVRFADALCEALAAVAWSSPIKIVVFHPVVLPEDMLRVADGISYKKAEPSVHISVNIPYSLWMRSNRVDRVNLHARALSKGIAQIKPNKLVDIDKAAFLSAVERTRRLLTKSDAPSPEYSDDVSVGDIQPQSQPVAITRMLRGAPGSLEYHHLIHTSAMFAEHWGRVGQAGESTTRTIESPGDTKRIASQRRDKLISQGFRESVNEDYLPLSVIYRRSKAPKKDLERRYVVEERLTRLLELTGLGTCDGGGQSEQYVEVSCSVCDVEIARQVIANDLEGTKFGDYVRISEEPNEL